MVGWIIFACILAVLALLLLLRAGAEVSYGEQGLRVQVRVGAIRVTLYPRKKRAPKKKKPSKKPSKERSKGRTESKKSQKQPSGGKQPSRPERQVAAPAKGESPGKQSGEKTETASAPEQKKGGLPLPLMDLIALVLSAAGNIIARLQIDTLEVGYTIAGKTDPAGAAIQYGLICAGEGGLVPVLENSFYGIRNRDIRAKVDFEATESLIWLRLALSIRIGQALSVACRAGWAFLKSYWKQKKTDSMEKTQEGNQNGTKTSNQ